MTLNAELSAPSGWHTTVPLAAAADVGEVNASSVTLDLYAFDARAQAAADATGLPAAPLTVDVVANIRTDAGLFTPKLTLLLEPLKMSISGDPKVTDSASTPSSTLITNTVGVGPFPIGVLTARIVSLVLLLGSVIAVRGACRTAVLQVERRRGRQHPIQSRPVTAAPADDGMLIASTSGASMSTASNTKAIR